MCEFAFETFIPSRFSRVVEGSYTCVILDRSISWSRFLKQQNPQERGNDKLEKAFKRIAGVRPWGESSLSFFFSRGWSKKVSRGREVE